MFQNSRTSLVFVLVMRAALVLLGFGPVGISCGDEPAKSARVDLFGDPLPPRVLTRLGSARLHDFAVLRCVEFSSDGSYLATGGGSGVIFWNLDTGRELRRLPTPLPVLELKFSPDGRSFGIQTDKGVAITRTSLDPPASFVEVGQGDLLGISRDGNQMVLAAGDAVRVLDLTTGKEFQKLSRQPGCSAACSFHAGSNTIAYVDDSGQLLLTKIGGVEGPRVLCKATKGAYTSLTISDDGSRLAYLVEGDEEDNPSWQEDGGYVDMVDMASGKKLVRVRAGLHSGSEGLQVRISPDLSLLASSSHTSWFDLGAPLTVVVRLADGKQVAQLPCARAVFSPDGKRIAGVQGSGVGVWRTATWERCFTEFGHGSDNLGTAVSPDERRLATADRECLSMWEIESGMQIWRQDLSAHHGQGAPLGFSANGEYLFVNRSDQIDVLRAASGEKVRSHSVGPFDCASQDGSCGIFWADGALRLQRVATNTSRLLLSGFTNETDRTGVAISPDGRLIAGTGVLKLRPGFQNRLVFWRTSTGEQVFIEDSQSRAEVYPFFLGDNLLATHCHNPKAQESPARNLVVREVFTGGICDEIPLGDDEFNSLVGGAVGPDVWVIVANGREDLRTTDKPGTTRLRSVLDPDGADIVDPIPRFTNQAIFLRSRRALLCVHAGEILVWQLPPIGRLHRDVPLDAQEFQGLWNDLASDSKTAWSAVKKLRNAGDNAIPFFEGHVSVAPIPIAKIQSLVDADLHAESDDARCRARDALAALGTAATAHVERLRSQVPSQRVRDDLDFALDRWSGPIIKDPAELRRVRVVQLLELIGTERAAQLLTAIAAGPAGARETLAAHRAVERHAVQRRGAAR
jgi:WD40 repeat protein